MLCRSSKKNSINLPRCPIKFATVYVDKLLEFLARNSNPFLSYIFSFFQHFKYREMMEPKEKNPADNVIDMTLDSESDDENSSPTTNSEGKLSR